MVIGIEKGKRSRGYFYAAKNMNIECRLIDSKSNHVMEELKGVDALIWHWSHQNPREKRSAPAIIRGAEIANIKVYPNTNTCWMFDDKVYEKYLLETLQAPIVETYVFYEYQDAIKWLEACDYPIVYKIPQGAGGTAVKLIRDYEMGRKVCKKHFSMLGSPEMDFIMKDTTKINEIIKRMNQPSVKYGNNQRGCIYFQTYLAENMYDIRVTTIGQKNYIFKRYVRDNDFRASGSGKIDYRVKEKDLEAIIIARKISDQIGAQSMAYDFLYDGEGKLKICEMSYGFKEEAVNRTNGWYDTELKWHEENVDVYKEIVNLLIKEAGK